MPLISILIPTFNDLGGLTRIIKKIPLDLTSSGQIEVIISDDSSDQEIKNYFKNNLKQKSGFYFFRGSGEGAVKNWNFLLSKCKGRFIQFIHHDESPFDRKFFDNLLSMPLISNKNYFHSVYLNENDSYRMHSTKFLNTLFLKIYPDILCFKNFIGSPSNVLIARENIVPFDERLVDLVDVDWYLKIHKIKAFSNSGQKMISYKNEKSITQNISKDKKKIRKYEKSILNKNNFFQTLIGLFFSIVWYVQKFLLYFMKRKNL
jgi:glycosyltransferase involved in cell wall biosynthesis